MADTIIWGPYDQAALDQQYNNRAAVPGVDAILEDQRARSEAARSRHGVTRLAYGALSRQGIDLLVPRRAAKGTVLFFPGGQWQFCDPRAGAFPADPMIAAGWRFAVADHRLLPEATLDQVVADAIAAVRHVLATQTGPLVLAGTSSGAHLALFAACDPVVLASADRLSRLVLVSGMHDLEPVRRSYRNAVLKLSEDTAAALSPIHRIAAAAKAWRAAVFAVGDRETQEFRRQTRAAFDTWTSAGGLGQHVILPDASHFDATDILPADLWLG